jgi:hypothetical protein
MDGWSLAVSYLIRLRIRLDIRLIHPNVPLRRDIILLGYLPSRPGSATGGFFITTKYCRRSVSHNSSPQKLTMLGDGTSQSVRPAAGRSGWNGYRGS